MTKAELIELIREMVNEEMMTQSVVKKDNDGDIVIRKLIKFKKNSTRYRPGDNVDAEINPTTMNIKVDDAETWVPDIPDE